MSGTGSSRLSLSVALILTISLTTRSWSQSASDEGTHILVMVVQLASRAETVATGESGALGLLRANGVSDEDIRDGSVTAGIKYC
jgi:hypothetical protein